MGCIFSSPSEAVQRDRTRAPAAGANAAAAGGRSAGQPSGGPGGAGLSAGILTGATSPNVALPASLHASPSGAGAIGSGLPRVGPMSYGTGAGSVRTFATSYTDKKLREQESFIAIVKQARNKLIDISLGSRAYIGPLGAGAQARTARYERVVAHVMVPNASAGNPGTFFSCEIPRPLPAAPSAVLASLLAPPNAERVEEANACAAALGPGLGAAHGAGPHLTGRPVVLTYADFENKTN
jgi:hypothetical protein